MLKTWRKGLILSLVMAMVLSLLVACSGSEDQSKTADTAAEATAPGTGGTAIGFIFVGAKDDYGYNKAAYLGSEEVEKAFPDLKILRKENVPETAEAERVMEQMIRDGAKVIFPTSYGHLQFAINVAKKYPDVVFFHQGGLDTADNVGTYFGNIWETVYLAGIAAGKKTKTNKLGYIAAIPIPQVLLNINAFTMGAKSVNPKVTVSTVFTNEWCDPGIQATAANSLIDQGADVLSQHQDCTKTIIETAERRGVMSVGYHADASELAPKGWLTGAAWDWGKLYTEMAQTAVDGKFDGSKFDGRYRIGIEEGAVKLSPFGSAVTDDVKSLIEEKRAAILDGSFHPFAGPVKDQAGTVRIAEGVKPTVEDLEKTDYFVEGVIGNIPKN